MIEPRIHIIDSDYLLVYLDVPGYDRAGPDHAPIDVSTARNEIDGILATEQTIVMPISVIVEVGNLITYSKRSVKDSAERFAEIIGASVDSERPWAAYDETPRLGDERFLRVLAAEWSAEAERGVSIGDMAIRQVAKEYEAFGYRVAILTGDQLLKAYETATAIKRARRYR